MSAYYGYGNYEVYGYLSYYSDYDYTYGIQTITTLREGIEGGYAYSVKELGYGYYAHANYYALANGMHSYAQSIEYGGEYYGSSKGEFFPKRLTLQIATYSMRQASMSTRLIICIYLQEASTVPMELVTPIVNTQEMVTMEKVNPVLATSLRSQVVYIIVEAFTPVQVDRLTTNMATIMGVTFTLATSERVMPGL